MVLDWSQALITIRQTQAPLPPADFELKFQPARALYDRCKLEESIGRGSLFACFQCKLSVPWPTARRSLFFKKEGRKASKQAQAGRKESRNERRAIGTARSILPRASAVSKHVPRVWWSIGQSSRLISVHYRELGHLLRFGTCQPVGKLLARNSGSNLSLFLCLLLSSPSRVLAARRQLHWIGQSNLAIIEKVRARDGKTSRSAANRRAPKTNLSYQNVFLSTTHAPELIGRAKFHYGIIALCESPVLSLPFSIPPSLFPAIVSWPRWS